MGKQGEGIAVKFLRRKGYKIIEKNYRCALGEMDIIAEDSGVLSFIEVKTRISTEFGSPQAAVGVSKQKKIIKTAQNYLTHKGLHGIDCRFDVVAVRFSAKQHLENIELIKNAFQV